MHLKATRTNPVKSLQKTDFSTKVHHMVFNSRSSILGSLKRRCCIVMLAFRCKDLENKMRPNWLNETALPRNANEYPHDSHSLLPKSSQSSIGYIFAANSMGLSSFKCSWRAPNRRAIGISECVMTLQGHSRSMLFVSSQLLSGLCDFLSI